MRHRVASGGDYKRGTTRDDSCGWAAIPVAISLAESSWRGAIPVTFVGKRSGRDGHNSFQQSSWFSRRTTSTYSLWSKVYDLLTY